MAKRRRYGIRKEIDGSKFRFRLRRDGLHVRRGSRRERVVSFQDLADLAEGQLKMNLL